MKPPKPQKFLLPRRLVHFLKAESAGGVVMICSALFALIAANSIAADWYRAFVSMPLGLSAGGMEVSWPLSYWVNDVLMVLFFFLIGMELKREMTEGVLADRKQVLLPFVSAVGGMLVPAAIFLLVNRHVPGHWNGWAIPSATDIAFAMCVLMLVGKSVPPTLKVFLLAIAIFDDLGAILIIALFYNHDLAIAPLLVAVLVIVMLLALGRLRVASLFPYLALGVFLWFALHAGGIHTTLAGVITGLAIPRARLDKFMHALHPWVAFFILPVFAFTASGVSLAGLTVSTLLAPLPLSVALGLFLGKQVGIFGTSWLFIKSGAATLPEGTGWRHIYGVSALAGIGFTMSLFIGMLAFSDTVLQDQVKIGVLAGSLISSFWGWLVLKGAKPVSS